MQTPPIPALVRPDTARTERHHYPVWHQISTRFGDLDPLGHINNVAVTQLYDECRVWFNRLLERRANCTLHRLVLAAFSVHYLAETQYPEPVELGVGVVEIGRTSYRLAQALYQQGRCVGVADSAIVHAPVTGTTPLPEEFRAELEKVRLT